MKILFVHELPIEMFVYWQDGLAAALAEISNEHEVIPISATDTQVPMADFVIAWGGATSRPVHLALQCPFKKALLYGGGILNHENTKKFDVVFVENTYNFEELEHPNKHIAFGTNTDLFVPMSQPKVWDYVYPTAFSKYKNHKKFIELSKGKKALWVGQIQPNEIDIYNEVFEAGVQTMSWVPYSVLPYIINASKEVLLTPVKFGGCERAVLEAAACNVPVRIETDCPKVNSFANIKNRADVLNGFTHYDYARQIMEGLISCLA